jgi:dolichol-phosphate mannosyltransferase
LTTAIIIPTYNEESNIGKLIKKINQVQKPSQTKIIVIDDNSTDSTQSRVKKLMKRFSNIHLVVRNNKDGRGSAVVAGLKYALTKTTATKFIEMDADFSHSPSELKTIIKKIKTNRIVIASRYLKKSKIIDWPLGRRINSKVANWLTRLILGLRNCDNTNGFRGYSKTAAKKLCSYRFISSGYMLLSESAYVLRRSGFKIIELETKFTNRKRGKSNANVTEFIKAFFELLLIRFKRLD